MRESRQLDGMLDLPTYILPAVACPMPVSRSTRRAYCHTWWSQWEFIGPDNVVYIIYAYNNFSLAILKLSTCWELIAMQDVLTSHLVSTDDDGGGCDDVFSCISSKLTSCRMFCTGKEFLSSRERATLKAKYLHLEQSLGCVGNRAGYDGTGETCPLWGSWILMMTISLRCFTFHFKLFTRHLITTHPQSVLLEHFHSHCPIQALVCTVPTFIYWFQCYMNRLLTY